MVPGAARYPAPSCDVAVVGAGPVGLTLALLLGRWGWDVQVLEARPEPFRFPRAVHLDHHAARILQSAGIMDALIAHTEVMDAYEWQSADGTTLLRIEGGDDAPSGWPASLMFAQPDLEQVLETRIGQIPNVAVRRGWTVTGLDPNDGPDSHEGPVLQVAGVDRELRQIAATWVVGCDGVHSSIRRLMDVAVDDFGHVFDWLVVDVVPDHPTQWRPLNVQRCDPARPTTAVSGGPRRRRWEFMRLPGESAADLASPSFAWQLLEPWGVTPANARIERSALYSFGARLAQQWAQGAVLLAGDAAHQMPPFAGQGLCSGLRDVANVAWKLDAVLAAAADRRLIDTYQGEREPQVRAEIQFSIDLGEVICVLDPEAAAVRDSQMADAAAASGPMPPPPLPPLGPGCAMAGDGHAGELVVQGMIESAGRSGRADDVLGTAGRWALLGWGFDPRCHLDDELARWFDSVKGVIGHFGPGAVSDTQGAYGVWFTSRGVSAVLQRPDFSVFGTAVSPSAVDGLLRALRVALWPATR